MAADPTPAPRGRGRPKLGEPTNVRLDADTKRLYRLLGGGELSAGLREAMRLLLAAGLVVDPEAPPAPAKRRGRPAVKAAAK